MSTSKVSEVEKQLDNYIQQGFIHPSISPWPSPILLVKKKGGSIRMCVDYHGLNEVMTQNKYPLPQIFELLDHLGKAKLLFKNRSSIRILPS